jgi:hypothetical protein
MPSFTHPEGATPDVGGGPAALQDAIKMATKAPA